MAPRAYPFFPPSTWGWGPSQLGNDVFRGRLPRAGVAGHTTILAGTFNNFDLLGPLRRLGVTGLPLMPFAIFTKGP